MLRGFQVKDMFPALFLLLMVDGFVLGGSYLWIKIQVWKTGEKLNPFSFEHDTLLFREYRKIANTRHLPIWPLYLYWACLVVMLIVAVGLFATIRS
jgi:hypothetical protein